MHAGAGHELSDTRIQVRRVIHAIHAAADISACRARYLDMLGGMIFAEGYFEAEDRDMALLYVADFMMEPMSPRDPARLEKHFARYLHRYGPGFHSFEIKIDDGPAVAARMKECGCKLSAEYGFFFYVRQESTGGVLLEVCERPMPNDPFERGDWNPQWAGRHATTLQGLDHIACITPDVGRALEFFTHVLDGELLSDEHTHAPQAARRALVRLAQTNVAFLQPDDLHAGPLASFLEPPTSGIYSLVWRVEHEETAEAFFREKGLRTTRQDCVSKGFAIEPDDFFGARHEFTASPRRNLP
jgi:catechol 2,3-dioxygenase-like lactoylglutathione lyase family enzyme